MDFDEKSLETAAAKVVVEMAATKGDTSNAAATSGEAAVDISFIPFTTPAGKQEDPFKHTTLTSGYFIEPPEDPWELYKAYQVSAYLQPIIDALQTNVYKAGYVLKPIIPFDSPDEAFKLVKEALIWRKAEEQQSEGEFNPKALIPSDDEVNDLLEELKLRAIIEKHFLTKFFNAISPDMPFRQFNAYTGMDYEVLGNAYWEVIRDDRGKISRLQWLRGVSMRCTPQDTKQFSVTTTVRSAGFQLTKEVQIRRFRRYGQIADDSGTVLSWFKEYGDPRVLSRATGTFYNNIQELQDSEGTTWQEALPANEVIHLKIEFGKNPAYGLPRWAGVYLCVRGSRDLDEENLNTVKDSTIPSLMVLVSGGIVGKNAFDRLEKQIEARRKGGRGIMLVQATSATKGPVAPTQVPKIQIERMRKEQTDDMLYQQYDERNEIKVESAFRIPSAALGKTKGLNKATAFAMRQYAEDQVYAPKRADKDAPMNDLVLPDLGITMWRYETQSMQPRDPLLRAQILQILVESGVLTPNEAREQASTIFNQELSSLEGLWTLFPPRVLTVLLQTKNAEMAAALLSEDKEALARFSNAVRDSLGLGPQGAAKMTVPEAKGSHTKPPEGD